MTKKIKEQILSVRDTALTNMFDCFNGKYNVDDTPVALHISQRVLTLPLYADLSLEDVDRICDIILE